MTNMELIIKSHKALMSKLLISDKTDIYKTLTTWQAALYALVELHQPDQSGLCEWCTCRDCDHIVSYPCKTIHKIQLELS